MNPSLSWTASGAWHVNRCQITETTKSVAIWAASIATRIATPASSAFGEPASARTSAGPTVNHALAGASSSRPGTTSPRRTSGTRAITIAAAMASGTSHGGSKNSTGTRTSWTGDVQASGSSKRAPWAIVISAMLISTSSGSAARASGAIR